MKILLTGASGFIGTNAIEHYLASGDEVRNVDAAPPLNPAQTPHWRQADILDAAAIRAAFADFGPEAVVHLAARSDCVEDTTVEAGYRVNTDGMRHVLDAIKATPSIRRVLIASSQFVCGPGYAPQHDEDFHPVTVYGQSKVITEQLTRAADLSCVWTIARPTNIWGPWHQRYQREFWRVLARGWYAHPAGAPVIRCYGYVGNLVRQMRQLLDLPAEFVDRQVFYLGDRPGDILRWVNAFSVALRGRRVRTIPRPALAAAGLVGDVIGALAGHPFYINTSRFLSMTTDYLVNMDRTFLLLGEPPIALDQGVAETVAWLRRQSR
jgi:nucleoside-diphosphate-sugar epimerase